MPLLRKQQFVRRDAPPGIRPDDEIFYCEATKEAFRDYDEFFQRTILCNSLVWSCAVTGKSNLTFEEALESERKARKRLGAIPRPLKRGLLWVAHHTSRGRITDLVDDVYVFASARYFTGEIVEGIIGEQWCDCKIVAVVPPTQEEIDKDAQDEREERQRGEDEDSPKRKSKKSFFPPDHLFKYELEEVEPDDPEVNPVHTVDADDIRREKGTYTREKNLLFLKNMVELGSDGNLCILTSIANKYKVDEVRFTDIFAGPEPVFEVTKRLKGSGPKKVPDGGSSKDGKNKKKASGKGQGTLDSWVKGGDKGTNNKVKKQTAAEIEAEMKRIREQNERFKEEMRQRAEEAKKRKMEEKAKEKERKKEEKRLVTELMADWKKTRDDLECDDLRELPKPLPIHCRLPNHLFGDFLSLLEFFHGFSDVLVTKDTFPDGVTFDILESALTHSDSVGGPLYDILRFLLQSLQDLQQGEEEEVKLDPRTVAAVGDIDKTILGKDEDTANQIRSATKMAQWPVVHQGQALRELHMDEWSITEILRLHLESAGAFRSDKLTMWLYQQRGGYRLSDDAGLQFRMEEPQVLEALTSKTVYELDVDEKLKILLCLTHQILSYANVRDEIDEKFNELTEAKTELRAHQIGENKRQRLIEEAVRAKKREERLQKKEDGNPKKANDKEDKEEKEKESEKEMKEKEKKKEETVNGLTDVHLTERQREAIQAQKDKEEKERQRKEDIKRSEALEKELALQERISELQAKAGPSFLGRDRAYRRFWVLESLPGLFVEHDDDFVGACCPQPTTSNPNSRPLDEATALEKAREMLNARGKSSDEKSGSDKENDQEENKSVGDVNKTYARKNLKQKVLSAKNGSLVSSKTEAAATVNNENEASTSTQSNQDNDDNDDDDVVEIKPEVNLEEEKPKFAVATVWGACSADMDNCTVHSTILPKTHWSYFGTVEELDSLIASLNPRGLRESELKERLANERERLARNLKKFNNVETKLNTLGMYEDVKAKPEIIKNNSDHEGGGEDKNSVTSISSIVDLTLRDQIMEMEEKIFFGTLGSLKIRDRAAWQSALQAGGYDKQCDTLAWGGKSVQDTPFESALVSRDPSRPASPDLMGNKRDSGGGFKKQQKKVRELASAILQVAQMLDVKYLKAPLGEDEKDKKKRLKEEERRRKEREAAAEETEGGVLDADQQQQQEDMVLTSLQEWENSLMSSTSYAQLFIHLTTVESSIVWSKSVMNAKCRICRRKTDPEKMLLCDGCDRGHHMYCLKPKLKSVPTGDWYCNDCKPTQRIRSPKKKSRRVFSTAEEDEANDEDNEQSDIDPDHGDASQSCEDADDDSEDEELAALQEDSPPRRRKKGKRSVDPPKKEKKKKGKKGLSQLLGKRRCATEASEKIARVTQQETASGNSSGSETPTERQSSRLRATRSTRQLEMQQKQSHKEQRLSVESSLSLARTKRRRAVDEELLSMFNPTALEDLLNHMMKHRDGWPFDRPITKADAPDYHRIIDKPMDLGTVRSNIIRMKYTCNQEVLEDIRQVFANCWAYNRTDAEEYMCGMRLEKYYLKEAKRMGLIDSDEESNAPAEAQNHLKQKQHSDQPPATKKARRTF